MIKNIPKTERIYKKSKPIDSLSSAEAISLMIKEHRDASLHVKKAANSIEIATNKIHQHLHSNPKGRLIYVGAGTSGRIGVQDGVELLPTFGWPSSRVDFMIAGGKKALLRSIENSEDDSNQAKEFFEKKKINLNDIVIGIAASGNTPFTNEILKLSFKNKIKTVAISNNPDGKILKKADFKIILDTKEEVVAGSTRLKAGTAQKICLNIISTLLMTNLGKVKNGMMVNLIPNNKKLKERLIRIKSYKSEF